VQNEGFYNYHYHLLWILVPVIIIIIIIQEEEEKEKEIAIVGHLRKREEMGHAWLVLQEHPQRIHMRESQVDTSARVYQATRQKETYLLARSFTAKNVA